MFVFYGQSCWDDRLPRNPIVRNGQYETEDSRKYDVKVGELGRSEENYLTVKVMSHSCAAGKIM